MAQGSVWKRSQQGFSRQRWWMTPRIWHRPDTTGVVSRWIHGYWQHTKTYLCSNETKFQDTDEEINIKLTSLTSFFFFFLELIPGENKKICFKNLWRFYPRSGSISITVPCALLGHLLNVFFIVLFLSKKIIDSLKSVNCITEMGSKICYYIMTLCT